MLHLLIGIFDHPPIVEPHQAGWQLLPVDALLDLAQPSRIHPQA